MWARGLLRLHHFLPEGGRGACRTTPQCVALANEADARNTGEMSAV